jgi:hypothetical protein
LEVLILTKIPTKNLWKVIKIILVIQIFNAFADSFTWLTYGYLIPIWTIATMTVFYTLLIFAVKVAIEKVATAPERTLQPT